MKKFDQFLKESKINENMEKYVWLAGILNEGSNAQQHLNPIQEDSEIFFLEEDAQEHIIDFFEELINDELDSLDELDTYISDKGPDLNGYYYHIIRLPYNR